MKIYRPSSVLIPPSKSSSKSKSKSNMNRRRRKVPSKYSDRCISSSSTPPSGIKVVPAMCYSAASLALLVIISSQSTHTSHAFSVPNSSRSIHSTVSIRRGGEQLLYMSTVQEERTATSVGTSTKKNGADKPKIQTYKNIKEAKELNKNVVDGVQSGTTSIPRSASRRVANGNNASTNVSKKSNIPSATIPLTNDDSPDDNSRTNEVRKRIYQMTTGIKSSRSSQEQQRSSERVNKAELLLRDLMADPSSLVDGLDAADTNSNSNSNSNNDSTTPTKDGNNPSQQRVPQTSSTTTNQNPTTTDETTTPTTKVPDSYWYNGNLQSGKGSYVTRWAKGVKVAEPLRRYDQAATERRLFSQPAKWILRNIQIGFPILAWAAGVATDVATSTEQSNRPARARQLRRTIGGLGPAIIKGGQALASRSDLLPGEYLEELQKLQDDVPRFANERAFRTVEVELGVENFGDVFELVEEDPIAAASIGQVYKAKLRSNGDVVALKIQRPRCEEVIALDLYVLRWWSGVANVLTRLLNRDIDMQSIIDDFGELIYRELDYVAEAANAQRFSELYAGGSQDVFVPKVYSELTTSKVLTMEWVDGYSLTDSENLERYNLDREKLVDTLVQCSLRQILENGFFHADPHAGNLLACEDGRLCYLDFGMMSYASAAQRNGFLLAVIHIVNRDWDELVRMYQRLGFIPEGTDLEPIAVALEKSLPDALNSEVSELNFKNVVGKLGDIMYTYPFSLPPFYISIIRCLGVLEGLAIQVNPKARIISDAYPYIASRVLTDTQDELQEALRRLALTSEGAIRWNRLESLLEKAKGSQGYDATIAVDQLTNYLISDDGEQLLLDLADQIVEGADSLSAETLGYVTEAIKAFTIDDEVAAARAFKTLQTIFSADGDDNGTESGGDTDRGGTTDRIRDTLVETLPEASPSMKRFWRIASLLGATGTNSDPSKLIPIFRKLGQEPRIQRVSSEIAVRLGERTLSRSLRAMFGLPPPSFEKDGGVKSSVVD